MPVPVQHQNESRGVLIGYDRRFLSDRAASVSAEVFAGNNIRVTLVAEPFGSYLQRSQLGILQKLPPMKIGRSWLATLRAALDQTKGLVLVGVINSVGRRKDQL